MKLLTNSALSVNIPRCSCNSVEGEFCELRTNGVLGSRKNSSGIHREFIADSFEHAVIDWRVTN